MIVVKKMNTRVRQVLSSGSNGKVPVEFLGQDVTLGVQVIFQNSVFYTSRLEAQSLNFWFFLCEKYENVAVQAMSLCNICERLLNEKINLKAFPL